MLLAMYLSLERIAAVDDFACFLLCRTSAEDIKSLRLITAIKTPYLPDGRFDLEAFDDLVHMQIENDAESVIVGDTTGGGQLVS